MQTISNVRKPFNFLLKIALAVSTLFFSFVAMAQDTKKVDINVSSGKDGGNFFASPWVWVVGIAVFILLLVALLRGGSKNNA